MMEYLDPFVFYCIVSALVCGGVSLVELLDRYSHSTHVTTVLFNIPACFYIGINVIVGAVAIATADATGSIAFNHIKIDVISSLKAAGVGFGALAILRSNFATLSGGNDQEMALGPSAMLEKIKEYLDRKIDLLHKVQVDTSIANIMKDIDVLKAKVDLPALCLTGVKRVTKSEIEDLMTAIEDLFKMDTTPLTRSMMMGHVLYKVYGLEVLRSAVERLEGSFRLDTTAVDAAETDLVAQLKAAKAKLMERG